jgi:lipoprotein-anchoring transpeptidase ErfK/SrfK
MSIRHAISSRHFTSRRAAAMACVVALATAVTGCTASSGNPVDAADESTTSASSSPSPTAPPESQATVSSSIDHQATGVAVDEILELTAADGTFDKVRVTVRGAEEGDNRLAGKLSADETTWTATERLEPGARYRARAVAVDADGLEARSRTVFRTVDLTLDQQTFPSIAPLAGETVGVGMPVIVKFDVPVTDHAAIEKHLAVESTPKQAGSWHWVDDYQVHWRPKTYWQPGTDVTVHADINSVDAGNGIYGQLSRSVSFTIGDSVVSKVNVQTHEMKVYINGDLARTMPISAGKPGFITRSGTKVIMEKVRHKTMDAATIGIPESSPEYYNLEVEYAMRVTHSGEFLHAAPWSAGSQGVANVSHGCVGMSMEDAAWLFNISKRGDVVEVTGSDRHMTLYNGYGDWNASFKDYKQGSALS